MYKRQLEGPRHLLQLDDPATLPPKRRLRPLLVVVPDTSILRTTLALPRASRQDLPHAIDLFLREKTPFAPAEVLVHADEQARPAGDEPSRYLLRILPRAVLDRAGARWGIPLRRIGHVVTASAPAADFAPALFPLRRYTRWLAALPIALVVLSLTALAAEDLAGLRQRVGGLEAALDDATVSAKSLAAEAESRRQASAGRDTVGAAIAGIWSSFGTLEAIRHALPAGVHVTAIELRGAETKLAVGAPNVLAVMQALAAPPAHWRASVEGAITAAPQGDELGTIVLRAGDAP